MTHLSLSRCIQILERAQGPADRARRAKVVADQLKQKDGPDRFFELLAHACTKGWTDVLGWLHARDPDCLTVSLSKHIEAIEDLNLPAHLSHVTPLMAACYAGQTGLAGWLLEKGADVNEGGADVWTPLAVLAFRQCGGWGTLEERTGRRLALFDLLVSHGASVTREMNAEGFTALAAYLTFGAPAVLVERWFSQGTFADLSPAARTCVVGRIPDSKPVIYPLYPDIVEVLVLHGALDFPALSHVLHQHHGEATWQAEQRLLDVRLTGAVPARPVCRL
jgi:hypothetical protein